MTAAKESKVAAIVAAVFTVLMCCGYVFIAYQEAQAFNRLTGKHATTWDAMWVQLRVIGD